MQNKCTFQFHILCKGDMENTFIVKHTNDTAPLERTINQVVLYRLYVWIHYFTMKVFSISPLHNMWNCLNKQAHHFVSICSVKTYPIFSWWNIHVLYYIYKPDLIIERRSRKIIIKISVFNAILILMQLCFDQIITWKSWHTLLHILDSTLLYAHCLPLTTPFKTKLKFIHVMYEERLVLLWQL